MASSCGYSFDFETAFESIAFCRKKTVASHRKRNSVVQFSPFLPDPDPANRETTYEANGWSFRRKRREKFVSITISAEQKTRNGASSSLSSGQKGSLTEQRILHTLTSVKLQQRSNAFCKILFHVFFCWIGRSKKINCAENIIQSRNNGWLLYRAWKDERGNDDAFARKSKSKL